MPGTSSTARNQAFDGRTTSTNVLASVNLNTSDPGTVGTTGEASSTRQVCSRNAAASPVKGHSPPLTFTGQAAGTAHTHLPTFSASAGVFGISGLLGSSVTSARITVAAGAISISAN